MSCVIAIEHESGVLVGCDSFSGGDWKDTVDRPKWTLVGDHILVGYAGADRDTQVAELALKRMPRHRGEDEMRYLHRCVVEPIREAHIAHGINSPDETSFLIAYDGKAYEMQASYVLVRSARGYASIGIGESVALGALVTARKLQPDLTPKQQAVLSLEAAVLLRAHVSEPFYFYDLPKVRRN